MKWMPMKRSGRSVAALNGPQDLLRERATVLRAKRDLFVGIVNECAGLSCEPPEGTFYLMIGCTGGIGQSSPDGKTIRTDREFAAHLF